MRRSIRAIVFNSDEAFASPLRTQLLSLEGVNVVAEVDDAAMLGAAASHYPCDVIVVHLDPDPAANLACLGQMGAERPDIPVFAVSACSDGQMILNALRAGVREYLTKPLDVAQLDAAFERVAQQAASKTEPGRIIAVMNSVGGCGGSTLAVNLAVELAALCGADGGRVALVDLDYRFGQVATMLDLQPKYTIADLCESPEQCDGQLIGQAMLEHSSGVHVLARPTHFVQAESITAAHCIGVLTGLQELYQYVIVDGPTRYDHGAKAVLDLATLQVIVAHLTVPSVRNVHRMVEAFENLGYNLDRVKVVCNRVGKDSGMLEQEHVEATLGRDLFFVLPDDWKTVSTSVNMGIPLAQSAPKARVRQAFVELAQQIYQPLSGNGRGDAAKANGEVAAGGKKQGNLFSKLFSS